MHSARVVIPEAQADRGSGETDLAKENGENASGLAANFDPSGKIWRSPAGDAPEVDMEFKEKGSLEFKKGYLFYNPAKWSYDARKGELRLYLPKADKKDFAVFKTNESKPGVGYENPKTVNQEKKVVIYKFPARINFNGFIFEEVK